MLRCLLVLLCCAGFQLSGAVKVLTENYPPFNYEDAAKKNAPAGVCVEIVQELIVRTGTKASIEMWPWSDAYAELQEVPGTALFSTTRTPEREELFHWVGPLAINNWALFAKADSDISLTDLQQAKQYKIGTYLDDAVDSYLRAKGLTTSLKTTTDDRLNARKLVEGSIDLWAGGELQLPFKFRQAGYNTKDLKKLLDLKRTEIYLAFNKQTDATIVQAWQAAFTAMQQDGSYQRIMTEHEMAAGVP